MSPVVIFRTRVFNSDVYDFRPDVKFFCDIDYDPFLFMQDQNKVYGERSEPSLTLWKYWSCLGFTISLPEYEATIPTLWDTVKGIKNDNVHLIWRLMIVNLRLLKGKPWLSSNWECDAIFVGWRRQHIQPLSLFVHSKVSSVCMYWLHMTQSGVTLKLVTLTFGEVRPIPSSLTIWTHEVASITR